MHNTICKVCKTPIDDALVIQTEHGPVHPGPCLNYVQNLPISESDDKLLNETELLL